MGERDSLLLWGGNYNGTEAQRTLTFWPLLYKGQIFEKLKVQMTYYEWDKVGC